ncbi:Elongator subunit elp4 [Geranomyces michiganensis]|nr:Elongator subunit elp4 [Geranomyces michiganensis]
MASSFKRRAPAAHPPIPSTRISAANSTVLTSTGVPAIDALLGGGLPLHSTLLIHGDRFTAYARLLLSYYLAQGIASGNAICLADDDPQDFIQNLMAVVEGKVPSEVQDQADDDADDDALVPPAAGVRQLGATRVDDKMRIAWRYQGLPKFDASVGAMARRDGNSQQPFCNLFDLTKRITAAQLNAAGPRMALLDVSSWAIKAEAQSGDSSSQDPTSCYDTLIQSINDLIDHYGFRIRPGNSPPPTVLRVAIHGLGSATWGPATPHRLASFMHSLRAALRTSYATAVVIIPHSAPSATVTTLAHLADAAIHVDSFAGSTSPVHPAYELQYHGFLDVLKIPRVGCLGARKGDVGRLGFKVRRKRFAVELCSLPPEGEGEGRGDVEEPSAGQQKRAHAAGGGGGCGSSTGGGNNPLDF